MKKINLITGFFLAALLFFVVTACDTGSGGQGADFDETQYYTKTEVNAAIDAAITDAVNQAADALEEYTPAITPVTADGPPKEVQQSGYANRIGPWTVPDGANFGIFRITIPGYDPAGTENDYVYIGANDASYEEFSIFHEGQEMNVVVPTEGNPELSAWISFNTGSGSEWVSITSVFWIK